VLWLCHREKKEIKHESRQMCVKKQKRNGP
jgi:hypothetical protein